MDAIDELINSWNPATTPVWILVFAIVVIILVLGKEFWLNLFGMLGSPSLTFQRLIGEVSLPPATFVVVICGFLIAVTLMVQWNHETYGDAVVAQFNIGFDAAAEQISENLGDVLPNDQIDFTGWLGKMQRDVAASLIFFVLMPLGCLVIWLLGGIGFHLGSMFSGNKGGGSIPGMLTASAYTYLAAVLVILFAIKMIYAGGFNTAMLIICGLYWVFLWTLLMREYGRYNYVKGFISLVVGFIITTVLTAAVTLAILWIIAGIMNYT